MDLLVHPTFRKDSLGNNLGVERPTPSPPPHDKALPEIENFANLMVNRLIGYVTNADPTLVFKSSQVLLDLLHWLANTVFANALSRYDTDTKSFDHWKHANEAILRLRLLVQETAERHVPVYQPNDGPQAPTESALELVYTSVLTEIERRVKTDVFEKGWQAIREVSISGFPKPNGMPQVGMMCLGKSASSPAGRSVSPEGSSVLHGGSLAPPGKRPTSREGRSVSHPYRLVVTTNVPRWDYLKPLRTWALRGREAGLQLLNDDYPVRVQELSDRLDKYGGFHDGKQPDGSQNLQRAWNDAYNSGSLQSADDVLQSQWDSIFKLDVKPPVSGNRTFDCPEVVTALPFNCDSDEGKPVPRARCVRCRVLFQFKMNDREPHVYEGKPYEKRLSCAEVTAYAKCKYLGLLRE